MKSNPKLIKACEAVLDYLVSGKGDFIWGSYNHCPLGLLANALKNDEIIPDNYVKDGSLIGTYTDTIHWCQATNADYPEVIELLVENGVSEVADFKHIEYLGLPMSTPHQEFHPTREQAIRFFEGLIEELKT